MNTLPSPATRTFIAVLVTTIAAAGAGVLLSGAVDPDDNGPAGAPSEVATDASAEDGARAGASGGNGEKDREPVDAPPLPPEIVAVTKAGAVVTLDPSDGRIVATIDDRFAGDAIEVHRAGDGAAWYSVSSNARCEGEIWRRAEGAPPQREATGTHPAVSPDGATLAYVDACADHALVLRDRTTGATRTLAADDSWKDVDLVTGVAWSADNRLVAVSARSGEGLPSVLYVLDAKKAKTMADRTRLGPPKRAMPGTSWSNPAFRAIDGSVLVTSTCCAGAGRAGASSVIAVDQVTGVERGAFAFAAATLAADVSGAHLLLSDADGRLHRRLAGPPVPLPEAPAVVAFDW